MKELKKQLLVIWSELKPLQKLAIGTLAILLGGLFCCLLLYSSTSSFISLYPKGRLSLADLEEVRGYLDQKQIEYQERGDGLLLVCEKTASKVRAALAHLGIPKQTGGKGFELFDSNKWIKGDKELQVLQMRALKGQLQQDLAEFENIKNASVILDLPSQRLFGEEEEKAKASVIVSLMPNAHLTPSELGAITYHLTGAVRGLKPNMIAICDTKGRLYQSIDPEGKNPLPIGSEFLYEEHIREKISSLIRSFLGKKNFFLEVFVKLKDNTGVAGSNYESVNSIEVFLLLDSKFFDKDVAFEALKSDIGKQVTHLLQMVCNDFKIKIERSYFKPHDDWGKVAETSSSMMLFIIFGIAVVCAIAVIYLIKGINRKKAQKVYSQRPIDPSDLDSSLDGIFAKLNSKTLHSLLCNEEPESLALFFSDMEKDKAERILATLPNDLQQKILKALL